MSLPTNFLDSVGFNISLSEVGSQESVRSQSGVSQELVRSQSGISQESVRTLRNLLEMKPGLNLESCLNQLSKFGELSKSALQIWLPSDRFLTDS